MRAWQTSVAATETLVSPVPAAGIQVTRVLVAGTPVSQVLVAGSLLCQTSVPVAGTQSEKILQATNILRYRFSRI